MSANDPLLPLGLAPPAAAMPRLRTFGRGSAMGAFGQEQPYREVVESGRSAPPAAREAAVRAL